MNTYRNPAKRTDWAESCLYSKLRHLSAHAVHTAYRIIGYINSLQFTKSEVIVNISSSHIHYLQRIDRIHCRNRNSKHL